MATETDGRTVLLKGVRLSFTESLKDKKRTSDESDKESHGCNLIIEADGPYAKFAAENKAKVMGAIRAACDVAWNKPERWKDIRDEAPKRIAFRPGERFKNREGVVYEGYAGNHAITAKGPSAGQKRPKLRDRHKRPVEEKDILDVMYSGSYADVYVSFYGTDKGSAGVFATLELIRSRQEGARIGGGSPDIDESELEDLDEIDVDLEAGVDDDEI